MSAKHRALLPAGPGESAAREQSQRDDRGFAPLPPPRKQVKYMACNACRKRKARCSGERPTCQECVVKETTCEYDAEPGHTRAAWLKTKNQRLEGDLSALLEVYWYLQSKPDEDANKALEAIQSGVEPSKVLELLGSERPESSSTLARLSSAVSDAAPGKADESSAAEVDSATAPTEEESSKGILHSQTAVLALKVGVEAFYLCTGYTFHIYDRDESKEVLAAALSIVEMGDWTGSMSENAVREQPNTSLCAAYVMAAVGLQYTRDPIPSMNFTPSTKAGVYPYVTKFYELGRALLEKAIADDSLEAMKVCAAMSMFNIMLHSTVAMAYTDMGLSIASNYGLNYATCPLGMDQAKFTNYRRVTRTLVTLRSWLVATLGYQPGDNFGFHSMAHWAVDPTDVSPREIIQQEMAKLTVMEANLLRTLDSFNQMSIATLHSIRVDLAQWHERLPEWMQLRSLLGPDAVSEDLRRVIFLLHLFYLSATMLVARITHGAQLSLNQRYKDAEIRAAVSESVIAARKAARILQLQLSEGTIFQRCWLCQFTAYMSSLTLFHSVANMKLHGYPEPLWQEELSFAKMALDVLSFCSDVDSVAKRFAETAQEFYDVLAIQDDGTKPQASVSDLKGSRVNASDNFSHLFANTSDSAPLRHLSERLLSLMSYPFGPPQEPQLEGKLVAENISRAANLKWNDIVTSPFNRLSPDAVRSVLTLWKGFSCICCGRFVGSPKPHGWSTNTVQVA